MPLQFLKKTYSGYHKPGGQKELLSLALPMAISDSCEGVMTFTFASVIAHWSFVPLLYICLKVLNLSVSFSWFVLVLFFLLFSLVLVLRFRSGKWKKINVI